MALTSVGLDSCKGVEWDTQETLDSVDITTTIVLTDTTMTTVTDGYRYADNITAHMFTVDPGIIDYNGKLHFDFYKTDGMIPWAWTEITYSKTDDSDVITYLRNNEFGWY